jgi:hypothetical protein
MNLADQTHPQEKNDRLVISRILQGEMSNENLADLARLRIRYQNFPGAREIQRDLNLVLQKWGLTEDSLFAKTREIHAHKKVYQKHNQGEEDWS